MDELAAALAHEIKNPASLALAHVGLIRLVDEQRVMRGYCDRIEQSLVQIAALATQLAQVLGGVLTEQPGSVDISAVLESILAEYRAAWPEMKFYFQQPEEALIINGEATQVRIIFTNLIKNAAEAAGPRGSVEVSAETSGGDLCVKICDNGPGVGRQPHIAKPGGSGMGLLICRAAVTRCGGWLEIKNGENGGCEASVTLPLPEHESSPI